MNGPLFVEDKPRFTPGRILVVMNSQIVAPVYETSAAQEILELERDHRDEDSCTEIARLISIYAGQLNHSEQCYDLGSCDGSISPCQYSLNRIDRAIGQLKNLRDIQQLAVHRHRWDSCGFCSVCASNVNA